MTCFCDKLRAERYSSITKNEAEVLNRVFEKAPYLFTAYQPALSGLGGQIEAISSSTPKSVKKGLRPSSNSSSRIRKKQPQASPRTLSSQAQLPRCTIQDISQEQPSDAVQRTTVQSVACVTPSIAIRQDITTAAELEKTYRGQNLAGILTDNGGNLRFRKSARNFDVVVDIFLAIEESDQINQLSKRIYCYALAKLHPKGTSVDEIVQRVQDVLGNVEKVRSKVYHYLRLGSKWETIVNLFESISKDLVVRQSEIQLTGILCVLGTGSLWERAPKEECQNALIHLHAKTDIYEQVKNYTPIVDGVLRKIYNTHSFVNTSSPYTVMSNPKLPALNPNTCERRNNMKLLPMSRGFCTTSSAASHWKVSSIAAASEAFPGGIHSDDAKLLLVLLCFLSSSEVPVDLLFRGATPRKRWNDHGEIKEVDALHVSLLPELVDLLSDVAKLDNALWELQSLSAISRNSDRTYILDRSILARVSDSLPAEFHSFWRQQTLVVAYRSIPWKYLEPGLFDTRALFIPHIHHTLKEFGNHDGFQELAANTRTDLILTLVEASRFSNIEWKWFAISQAKLAMQGLNDDYLQSCVAQRECLLYRTAGDTSQAAHTLRNTSSGQGQLQVGTDMKMRAGYGYMAIQRAWNHIQIEELAMATNVLDAWQPLCRIPSTIEEVVLFRKHVILGKILRFQGKFRESLAHLERSKNTVDQRKDLFFDEDRSDLACNLADTLIELDEPISAEHYLRTEIAHQGQNCAFAGYLLKLALAESLFAQGKYAPAEALCLEVQSRPSLSKIGELRLSIIQAKSCHVNSDLEGAFRYWTNAMLAISQFAMTNGHTTRIILLSICDILRRQKQHELELKSRDQLTAVENLAGSAAVLYWIAGLRHWLNYLQSTDRPRRSRI